MREKITQMNLYAFLLMLLIYLVFSMQHSFGQASQTFLTSGSFTVPAGVTALNIEVWGGGGAGGGATGNTSAGGGGAGGSYVKNTAYVVIPGNSYTVTVGTGGIGNTTNGAAGGDSWFNNTLAILAKGGLGGTLAALNNQTAAGATAIITGNVGVTIPFSYYGGAGGAGGSGGASGGGGGSSAGTGSNGNSPVGITGGLAVLGGGAGVSGSTNAANGANNPNLGGGGAGGRTNSKTNLSGGDGGDGKVIISWTCPTYSVTSTSSVSPICNSATTSIITLSSTTAALPVGAYTVTYNRSSPLATALTAAMTITTAGTGTFVATGLTTLGASTITVTKIESGLCSSVISSSNTTSINVVSIPQVSIFDGNTICVGATGQLTLTSSAGTGPFVVVYDPGAISKTLVVSGTSFNVASNPIITSNYNLVSVTDNNGCKRLTGFTDATATIIVNDPPAITVLPVAPAAVCSGSGIRSISVTATGFGLSYQWLKNGVALANTAPYSNVTTSTLTITNPTVTENGSNFSVVVTGTCAPTTITSASVLLTVNALPTSNNGIQTICTTMQSNYDLTSLISNGIASTYSWSAISNLNITGEGSGTGSLLTNSLTNTSALNQVVTYNVIPTSIIGSCQGASFTVAVTVSLSPLPQVSIFNGNTICVGATGQLTLTTSAGTGPFVVVYDPGAISKTLVVSGTSFNVAPNPTVTNNYTLVSVTDNNGCKRLAGFTDATATIIVNDPPAITVLPVAPAAVCSGSGIRTISVIATGFGLSYQWLKNGVALTNTAPYSNVTTSTLTITNPTVTENGSKFSVVVTGTCAPTTVTSSPTVTLIVNALPILSSSGILSICKGSTTILTPITGGTWVSGSSAIATITNAGLVTGVSIGTTNFTFTQSSTGCISSIPSIEVKSVPLPVVEFTQGINDHTAAIGVCGVIGGGAQNDMDIFSGNPGGTSTIQWQVSLDNGANWITAPGPTSTTPQYVLDPLFTFYESFAGVYLFRTLITDNGCTGISNSITLTVTGISTLIGGVIAGNQSFCSSGNPIAFTQTTAPTGGSTYTYQWQSSFDNINFTNIVGVITNLYDPPVVAQTTYYRRIVVSGGCSKFSNTLMVTINSPIVISSQPITSSLCLGGNSTFNITTTGTLPTFQWQLSVTGIGGVYSNVVNSSIYAGVNSSTLNLTVPPLGFVSNFYRVSVIGTCSSVISNSISLKLSNVWMGSISSDWNDKNNWSDGMLPSTICSNVLITNQINQPILSSTPDAIINNLIIDPGAILTVTNATLKIAGAITNNGSLDVSKGSLDFNGTLPQNISANLFLGSTIKNLMISNASGLSLSNALGNLMITGDLAFGKVNNATLNTGDNIVLVSSANATARVTDITNNGANVGNKFSGKVIVERFFPARRAWRLVTAPLSGAGSVFNTWQNKGVYEAGKGTYVTGPAANLLINGLDPSPLNNTSLKTGSSLSTIANTYTTNLSTATGNSDNKGFFIFVRGDRTANNLNVNYSNITTLKSIGNLQTGDQQFTASSIAGAFTLIGNPYAAPVDFSKLARTNLNNRFYAWDPYLGNDQGGYVILDDIGNTGTYTVTPASPGGQTQFIQSSQAIFVETFLNGSSAIKFTEVAKSSSALPGGAFIPPVQIQFLKTNLFLINDNGVNALADGNLVEFDNHYSDKVDGQDAIKLSNVNETLSLNNGGSLLAINRRPLVAIRDTVNLNFSRNRQRKYQFQFETGKLKQDNSVVYLEDKFLNKLTPLIVDGISKVDFEVNSNLLSAASNRFSIIFSPAVSFNKVNATIKASNILVDWELSNEFNIKSYDVERSNDGISFTKFATNIASGNRNQNVAYSWLDIEPLPGYYYYRIKILSNNNLVVYSKIVKLKINKSTPEIYVFPNPIIESNIQLQMNNMPQGIYLLKLVNNVGQVMGNYQVAHTQNNYTENIHLLNRLIPGIYQLEVTHPNHKVKKITISAE